MIAGADAEGKLRRGNQLLEERDYGQAIKVVYAALELDTQSLSLDGWLYEALTVAEAGMAAQEVRFK